MLLKQNSEKICQVPMHLELGCPFVVHSRSNEYASDIAGNKETICSFISKSKIHVPVEFTEVNTENGIVLLWYITLPITNPLIVELNKHILPAYLCYNSYGWFLSSEPDDCVFWQHIPNATQGEFYLQVDSNTKKYLKRILN